MWLLSIEKEDPLTTEVTENKHYFLKIYTKVPSNLYRFRTIPVPLFEVEFLLNGSTKFKIQILEKCNFKRGKQEPYLFYILSV